MEQTKYRQNQIIIYQRSAIRGRDWVGGGGVKDMDSDNNNNDNNSIVGKGKVTIKY
jgi:hypothetical protein